MVATTRKAVDGARAKPWFGAERASGLSIMHAKLTPPDDGRFSLASVGLDDWRLDAIEPVPQIGDLPGPSAGARDVLIYVHGFNQTFETAVLDAARLSDGIRFRGDTMAFSWPSRANLLDYGYDRDSAMWSRDALEKVLDGLMASPTVGRLHIVAHSIGTMLTLEALRQLYAHHGDAVADRLGAVVFASPDIDMDVFTSSIDHIGPHCPQHHRSDRDERSCARAVAMDGRRDDPGRRRPEGSARAVGAARDRRLQGRLGHRSTTTCSCRTAGFERSFAARSTTRRAPEGAPTLGVAERPYGAANTLA